MFYCMYELNLHFAKFSHDFFAAGISSSLTFIYTGCVGVVSQTKVVMFWLQLCHHTPRT